MMINVSIIYVLASLMPCSHAMQMLYICIYVRR
jgi:hypothetical protein